MKKVIEKAFTKIKNDNFYDYILLIVIAFIAAIPLSNLRIYGTHDGFIHILRIIGIDKIFENGIFPPLINSTFCNNFGYAINLFYAPFVTYGPWVFKFIFKHYYDCLKIFTLFTIMLSAITMYKLAIRVTKKRTIAVFAAIFYMLIPYRLQTIYTRFAIGEFTSYIFIPIVFSGLYNLLKEDGKKHYLIAIGAIGLLNTHMLSTEFTAIFCLIYVLLNYKKLKDINVLKKIVINVIFVLGISAFYLVPLLEHKVLGNYTIFDNKLMEGTVESVYKNAISPSSFFNDPEDMVISFKLGIPFILCLLLGIFTYRKIEEKYKESYLFFLLMAIISYWMATKYFPWMIMPKIITKIQFPWRMLMFAGFASSILCAINLYTVIKIILSKVKKESNKINIITYFICVVILATSLYPYNINYLYEERKKLEDEQYEKIIEQNIKISPFSINREYLPINSTKNNYAYLKTREDRVYVLSGKAQIENEQKGNLELEFTVEEAEKGTVLELPYIYYLGYNVTLITNKETKTLDTYESENGFVTITIPEDIEDSGKIKVKYTGTVLTKISYIVTLVFVVIFIIYIVYGKRKNKSDEQNKR